VYQRAGRDRALRQGRSDVTSLASCHEDVPTVLYSPIILAAALMPSAGKFLDL